MNKTLLALLIASATTAANAQTTAINAAAKSGAAVQVEETLVFGRGETRQVHVLGTEELAEYPAGISPLKAVEKLPGVNFQSADPYGAYEWSTRIVVRGFGQNQLGFTLDDVPLGDMSYGNHNGLHISRAIISENIGAAALSQGAGSLAAASTSNLGGTLEFTSLDPATEFAAHVDGSVGSDAAQRAFVRIDSGEFGGAGTRLFVSYVDQTTDKWKGDGEQEQEALNFKVVQPLGEATLTGFYSFSDRAEIDYQDLSLEMIGRLGRDWDNYGNDYARAIAAAQGPIPLGADDRILLVGDSLMQGLAPHLITNLKRKYKVEAMDLSKHSTGLTYPAFFDWPATVEDAFELEDYSVVIVFLGANDPWDMTIQGRYIRFGSEPWAAVYRERVARIINTAAAHRARLVWLGVPPLGREDLVGKASKLNAIYAEEADKMPLFARFVPTDATLTADGSSFTKFLELPDLGSVMVRTDDGVHFTTQGHRLLANLTLTQFGAARAAEKPVEDAASTTGGTDTDTIAPNNKITQR